MTINNRISTEKKEINLQIVRNSVDGKASYIIDGQTYNSLESIPIEVKNSIPSKICRM